MFSMTKKIKKPSPRNTDMRVIRLAKSALLLPFIPKPFCPEPSKGYRNGKRQKVNEVGYHAAKIGGKRHKNKKYQIASNKKTYYLFHIFPPFVRILV